MEYPRQIMSDSHVYVYDCEVHRIIPDSTKRSGFRHQIFDNHLSLLAWNFEQAIIACLNDFAYSIHHSITKDTKWNVDKKKLKAIAISGGKRYTIWQRDVDTLSCPRRLGGHDGDFGKMA